MSPQAILAFIASLTASFLSSFFMAIPFLMLGGLASGLLAVFVRDEEIAEVLPKKAFLLPILGALLGLVFPVGQVGTIPLARRLIDKGMPVSAVMAFVVAAPVVTLVAAASTVAAYGIGPILYGRLLIALIVGAGIGFLFAGSTSHDEIVTRTQPVGDVLREPDEDWRHALRRAARLGGDEVFDIGRYLVVGALLVAVVQALLADHSLAGLNDGPAGGVFMMMALRIMQAPEAAVSAFLSVLYRPAVTGGAILSYLAPVVDLQMVAIMLGVFKPKIVAYLFIVTLLAALLVGLFVTFNLPI